MAAPKLRPAYLGFDFSTQQVKLALCDDGLRYMGEWHVAFGADLPHYNTEDGVHKGAGGRVTSPVRMWIEALDLLLRRAADAGVDFSAVRALSGCGQQHGSVYWTRRGQSRLQQLDPGLTLLQNFTDDERNPCFAIEDCPVWMDSSTGEQCTALDNVKGPEFLARVTGSRAYHRFTGPQIMRIVQAQQAAYDDTARVSLVSSFACSLLLGRCAPMDHADASGANLFDIHAKGWRAELLAAVVGGEGGGAEALAEKLGQPVEGRSDLGPVSDYYVRRHGFSPACRVVVFTGDNPSALCGMAGGGRDVVVSWGTSDTVLCAGVPMPEAQSDKGAEEAGVPYPLLDVHLMCDPLAAGGGKCMAMLCFKNGAFTRRRARDTLCECATWEEFDALVNRAPAGNQGCIGFYYDYPEILPNVAEPGDWRFDADDRMLPAGATFASAAAEARAVLEHQCLAKWTHAGRSGLRDAGRILVTGGASASGALQQILADVAGAPVYVRPESGNAAALGAAYRAKLGATPSATLADVCRGAVDFELVAEPRPEHRRMYDEMAERYEKLEARMLAVQ